MRHSAGSAGGTALAAEIVALDPTRLDEATELCVRAFVDYPFLAALFPGSDDARAPLARIFYGRTLEDCLAHGHVDAAVEDGAVRAVAAWLPPGAYPMSLRRTLRYTPMVGAVLRRWPTRVPKGVQALSRLERHHPAEPAHWYLAVIAADRTHQRRGLGTRVIRPGLDLAEERGEDAFLETAKAENAAWYARLGFSVEVEAPCFDGGPPQWFMRRVPRP